MLTYVTPENTFLLDEEETTNIAQVIAMPQMQVDDDFIRVWAVSTIEKSTPEAVLQTLYDLQIVSPGFGCQHSYDCCGHVYPNDPTVYQRKSSTRFIVEQIWSRNV